MEGNVYIGILRLCISMLQRKLNSDHFGGWSGCFLCSSGTFPRAFGVANPRAPDSSAPERSADVGTKRTAEAPSPDSPVRRLPSARCHVCSSANLEKCSLRTAPVHQGRSVDFPDVELVRAMSPQLVLWRGGGWGRGTAAALAESCSRLWDPISVSFRGRDPVAGEGAWFVFLHILCLALPQTELRTWCQV